MRSMALAAIAAGAFSSLVLADDLSVTVSHPALAGYCVQSLRTTLQMDQALSSATLANDQRTFDLWRVYGLGLGSDNTAEFLRGVAEANADIAYLKDFATAHPIPPSASEQDFAKDFKAAVASDPRMKAIQDRMTACRRGPPL